jgi:hypothetical protein
MNRPLPLPPAFMPPAEACLYFGVSKTRLYDHFAKLDPGILVQVGGRTLVDVERLKALIAGMPRGPRNPSARVAIARGERADRDQCQRGGSGHDHQQ